MEEEKGVSTSKGTSSAIFITILSQGFQNRLRIPSSLSEQLPKSSQLAILKGPSGKFWHVKLNVTREGLFFEDGWANFAKDNSLHIFDCLLFNYKGSMRFSVKIFNIKACEREESFYAEPSQGSTYGRPPKHVKTMNLGTKEKNYYDSNNLTPQRFEKLSMKGKTEPESLGSYDLLNPLRGLSASSSKLKGPMVNTMIEMKERAYYFTSNFPFFVANLRKSSVAQPFHLNIPIDFAREHVPRDLGMLELRNEQGNKWKVKAFNDSRGYVVCSKLKSFMSENYLKVGDHCVFELVENFLMNVHIYRC